MPSVTLNPNVPPNVDESPGLGASRIRALTQALIDLFNLPSNSAVTAPLTMNRLGPLTNRTGAQLVAGDVVGIDLANDTSVVLADAQAVMRPLLVALATINNNDPGVFGQGGQITVRVFGAVSRGNFLRKSATTLALEDAGASSTPPLGAVGLALTAAAGPGAGTVTALLFGAPPEAGVIDVAMYGVAPSATAASNRASLQAAVNALPTAGGVLRFREYGIHIDAAINITKPIVIQGPGTTEVSTPGTFVLYLDTASQVGFNVTAKGPFAMRDMSLSGATGTTAVVLNGPTGSLKGTESVSIDNVVFYGGSIHVDIRAAIFYRITRCLFWNYAAVGVKVQNLLDGDQGDSAIENNCVFNGPQTTGVYGVLYLSGGGLKIRGNKFLGNDAAIAVDPTTTATDPATISDLIIANNSIESCKTRGIFLTRTSGTLAPPQIHIVDNQIGLALGTMASAIEISPASGTAYNVIVISGNIIVGMAFGLNLSGCTNLLVDGNIINVTGHAFAVTATVVNVLVGINAYVGTPAFMTGTPGAGFVLKGGSFAVAGLPVGIENSSQAFATDGKNPGDGGYAFGTVAAGGTGTPVYRVSGAWKA